MLSVEGAGTRETALPFGRDSAVDATATGGPVALSAGGEATAISGPEGKRSVVDGFAGAGTEPLTRGSPCLDGAAKLRRIAKPIANTASDKAKTIICRLTITPVL
jgi:hypothetical protein